MKRLVLGAFLFVCSLSLFVGTAGAVSLQACEGLVLTIPNQDLGLSPKVVKAPNVRLSHGGNLFPLTVTGFLA